MSARRWGALITVCLAGAGLGVWLLTRPMPVPPPVVLHPSAALVTATQQHLTRLGQAVATPGPGPRTLRLSETDLNVILATSKPVRKLLASRGIAAVQILLQEPNALSLYASVRVQGRVQNVLIRGILTPDPKTGLRFAVSGVQAGRFPLPPALLSTQASQLAARFSQPLLRRLSLSVQSVSVQKKELIIVGVPVRPAIRQPVLPAHH